MGPRVATITRVFCALLAATGAYAVIRAVERPDPPEIRDGRSLGTPVWSVRRTPQAVSDAARREITTARLTERVGGNDACLVATDGFAPLASITPDTARTPASTTKLLTAVAVLDYLGADHRFRTTVVAPGAVTNGTVSSLTLVGGGDPLLASPERIAYLDQDPEYRGLATSPLATLADRIVAAGVRSVPEGIRGVDTALSQERFRSDWTAGARAAIGPVGALTVNDGLAGPSGTGAAVADPAVHAAAELRRLLTDRGVRVGAPGRAEGAPRGPVIADLESPPLTEILTEMLSASDNHTAEVLLRSIGADRTTDGGLVTVENVLDRLGVDRRGSTFVDGSGLARGNQLTCTLLMDILELTALPKFEPVRAGLAIAGERGTLAPRLTGSRLTGDLRAKTGTLDGVSGLAGFLTADRPVTFALLVDGSFSEAGAFDLREDMAELLAAFGDSADPDALVPTPDPAIRARACPGTEAAC